MSHMPHHQGALNGLKVLDLSRTLSGSFVSMMLADLDADVIKVEDAQAGDDTWSWGPPFHLDAVDEQLIARLAGRTVRTGRH
jgi:crotonobetainyl-CoA:carnitine CoA-transferase CaiB-like acyl-CoA transferase